MPLPISVVRRFARVDGERFVYRPGLEVSLFGRYAGGYPFVTPFMDSQISETCPASALRPRFDDDEKGLH